MNHDKVLQKSERIDSAIIAGSLLGFILGFLFGFIVFVMAINIPLGD